MTDTEKMLEKQDAGAPSSGRVLRKAGRFEHYFNAGSRLNLTGYVTVCARYAHTSGPLLSKPVLFAALEDVIRKNIALAARFSPEGVWVALPVVDLNLVVEFVDKDRADLPMLLEELFVQLLNFSDGVPQWKLMVSRDGWVVFAYDHTIGDGQSGLAFHHNMLASLRSIHDPPFEHSGIVSSLPQDAMLTAALEDATDTSVPLSMIIRELSKLLLPFVDCKKGKAWAGYPIQKPPTLVTTVRLLEYTPDQASNLVKLSRDHHATLTSTIHTLALVVLSRLYAHPENKKVKHVHTYIPMSLRRLTGAPPSAICNHVSGHAAYHALLRPAPATVSKEMFPWDRTSVLTATLKRKLPHSARTVGMLKYLFGKYEEYFLGMLGKKRGSALELSNLGAFPEPPSTAKEGEEVQWHIQEMFFVQADATLGAALKVNPVGTAAGGLGISITWGKGAVDDALAEEFVRAFDEGLRTLAL
ncbi:alcohol acetyltransferase [Cerioporus squamosus]|nr:alcohol acetyltransferase [Cerioporus squamosus]